MTDKRSTDTAFDSGVADISELQAGSTGIEKEDYQAVLNGKQEEALTVAEKLRASHLEESRTQSETDNNTITETYSNSSEKLNSDTSSEAIQGFSLKTTNLEDLRQIAQAEIGAAEPVAEKDLLLQRSMEIKKELSAQIEKVELYIKGNERSIKHLKEDKQLFDFFTSHNENLDDSILAAEKLSENYKKYIEQVALIKTKLEEVETEGGLNEETLRNFEQLQEQNKQLFVKGSRQFQADLAEVDWDKVITQYEHRIVACEVTRDVSVLAAVTIATGGTFAAVGGVAGAAAGFGVGVAVGTGAGTAASVAEHSINVATGQSTLSEAGSEVWMDTKKYAKDSAITAGTTLLGMGVSGKIAGLAGKGAQAAGQITKGSQIVRSVATGATAGSINASASNVVNTAMSYYQAAEEFEFKAEKEGLKGKDYHQAKEVFLEERGLGFREMMINLGFAAATGAAAGAVGGGGNAAKLGTNAIQRLGITVVEGTADLAIGVSSATLKAKTLGREVTVEEMIQEVQSSVMGTIVGEMAAAADPVISKKEAAATAATLGVTEAEAKRFIKARNSLGRHADAVQELSKRDAEVLAKSLTDPSVLEHNIEVLTEGGRIVLNENMDCAETIYAKALSEQKCSIEEISLDLVDAMRQAGQQTSLDTIDTKILEKLQVPVGNKVVTLDKASELIVRKSLSQQNQRNNLEYLKKQGQGFIKRHRAMHRIERCLEIGGAGAAEITNIYTDSFYSATYGWAEQHFKAGYHNEAELRFKSELDELDSLKKAGRTDEATLLSRRLLKESQDSLEGRKFESEADYRKALDTAINKKIKLAADASYEGAEAAFSKCFRRRIRKGVQNAVNGFRKNFIRTSTSEKVKQDRNEREELKSRSLQDDEGRKEVALDNKEIEQRRVDDKTSRIRSEVVKGVRYDYHEAKQVDGHWKVVKVIEGSSSDNS